MASEVSLHQRRRDPKPEELAGIPWLHVLQPAERERAVAEIKVGDALPGDYVCRFGRPVTYWFGVVEGLLKMGTDDQEGHPLTGTWAGDWGPAGSAKARC